MRTTIWRVAGKLAQAVHEMNEAQRLMLALRTSTDRYTGRSGAPDTYQEFLARTSGALLHEPSARKRSRSARRRSSKAQRAWWYTGVAAQLSEQAADERGDLQGRP